MTKERIEIIRQSLIPFVKKELLDINYDGLGKSDAKEFEKDLNEVLDLASKALEQQPSDDCADINHVIATISQHHFDKDKDNFDLLIHNLCKEVKSLPPVTPTFPKGATNGDVVEKIFGKDVYCTLIRMMYSSCCEKLKNWWNALYKRGNENDI